MCSRLQVRAGQRCSGQGGRSLARARKGYVVWRGEGTWSGQRIQISPVLNLLGDDVFARHTRNSTTQIRRQEVVDRPFPPAHAGADSLLLDVLRQSRALLGVLGVEGSRQIAHGVGCALVSFEEHLFGVLTEEPTETTVHGLLFSSAQILAEDSVAAVDQLAVDVGVIGRNDCLDVL